MARVFIHSPLVGPFTWKKFSIWVPDLRPIMRNGPPFQSAIADLVARQAPDATVLIGHSSAGPLLPSVAARIDSVQALVYVDSGLPRPGTSWVETAPPDRVRSRRELVRDGMLPPWHQWFPPSAMPDLPTEFVAEVEGVPWAFFEERLDDTAWTGPAGYLLLSEAYRDQADQARALGMQVVECLDNHLAMVTSPEVVAPALEKLLSRIV